MSEVNRIYKLYGVMIELSQQEIGCPYVSNRSRELVATFSTEHLATVYVNRRKLKNPVPSRGFQRGRMFRKNTNLKYYEDYDIAYEPTFSVPHDPE